MLSEVMSLLTYVFDENLSAYSILSYKGIRYDERAHDLLQFYTSVEHLLTIPLLILVLSFNVENPKLSVKIYCVVVSLKWGG